MSRDFRAKQIKASQLIASGGIAGTKAGMIIYSASDATNMVGGFPANMVAGVGTDVYLFVSGAENSKVSKGSPATKYAGVTLFGGDVVFSGTMYAERMVVEVEETTTGSMLVSGSLFVSGSGQIRQNLEVNASKRNYNSDFIHFGTNKKEMIASMASANRVLILSGGLTTGGSVDEGLYGDTAFFVSGTVGSKGTNVVGVSLFGGDLVASGTIFAPNGISGSLTRLIDGTSYLIGSAGIDITSASNGAVTVINTAMSKWHDEGAIIRPLQSDHVGVGATGADIGAYPAMITTSGIIKSNSFISASLGFSGSLTRLSNGTSYLIGGAGTDIVSASNGAVTVINTAMSKWHDEGSILRPLNNEVVGVGSTGADKGTYPAMISSSGIIESSNFISASLGFSGSLTRLSNGTSYLIGGAGTDIVSSSNGPVTVINTAMSKWHDEGAVLRPLDSGDHIAVGATGADKGPYTAYINSNGIIESSNFISASLGFSGSLTRLTDGSSYLIAGAGIGISSASNGAITITGNIGDITGVTAGTGLNGGGSSGDVTVSLDYAGADSFILAATDGTGITVDGANDKIAIYDNDAAVVKYVNANQVGGTAWTDGTNAVHLTTSTDKVNIGGGNTAPGNDCKVEINVADSENLGGLYIDHKETSTSRNALYVDSANTSTDAVRIFGFKGLYVKQDITNGYAAYFTRNINEGGNEPLVNILDDHTANSQPALQIRQDGTGDILRMRDGANIVHKFKDGGKVTLGADYTAADTSFFVSGAINGRQKYGTGLFGGDLVVSGTVFSPTGISGSLTRLSNGKSYLEAGSNITIVSASNGAITISSTGGGGTPGGSNTQLQYNNGGAFGGISTVTTDGSAVTFGDSAILVGQDITHAGDTDTKIVFGDDAIGITVGNEQLVTITESGQDLVQIGDGGDVDFQVRTLGDDNTLFVKGDDDRVGIGINAPSAKLHVAGDVHIEEATPTITVKRTNNSNNSTLQFLGSGGHTANMVHLGSSNDLVFSTHDGSGQEEILRLGSHWTSDVRQVIMLSGSEMGAGAMQPKEASDINFFVSGAINSRGTLTRGTSVFGGDIVVSGTLSVNRGQAGVGSVVSITTDGKVGIGTDSPSYKLEVGGNMAIGEYIYHRGDVDTYIQFDTDAIRFNVGGKELINLNEDESTISINNDNDAINTVIKTDTRLAFAAGTPLGAGQDQILIMSGGGATSFNEAAAADVLVYISGSRTQIGGPNAPSTGRNSGRRTNTIFGGDVVFSGSIYGGGDLTAGNPAIHFKAGTIQADATSQIAMCDSSGNAPGFGTANASDVFFSVSGSHGYIGGQRRGVSVFGGDVVVSGSLRARQLHMTTHKLVFGDTTARFVRFDSNGGDTSAGANNKMTTPYNGRLVKVILRGTAASNNTVVGLHRNTNGSANVSASSAEDITVNMGSGNTSYTFNFTAAADWASGDIVGLKINPTVDPGVVIATAVWEFDASEG